MGILASIKNALSSSKEVESKKIIKKAVKQQLYRFNQEITQWKAGIENFENVYNQYCEDIIRVYNDITLDAHLSAVLDARANKVTSKNHKIVDLKGNEIERETTLLSGPWFRDFLRHSLDAKFYGYSLIQFGNQIGDSFEEVEVVPREYVYQQKKSIRKHPLSSTDLVPFDEGEFAPWVLGVGRSNDIGLLVKAAPLVIFKKSALGAWTEFAELFGAPFRAGKTDVRDDILADNMYNMLDNMGRNAFGVFDKDDEIQYIGDGKTDAYQVYNELIERSNSELSKLFLGSTMVVDEGSSRSQSEVHERTTAAINKQDAVYLEDVVNKQLIPFLNKYHGFKITGIWKWDDSENTTKKEQFDIDIELIKAGYVIPNQYISDTYGTPLEEKKETTEITNVTNSIKKKILLAPTYKDFILKHSCDVCNSIEETPPPEWSEDFIEKILIGVYSGEYSVGNLPEELYQSLAEQLTEGMFEGLKDVKKLENIPNPTFVNSLRNNAFVFSGAKTFQQVKIMSDFLIDENGATRTFKEYKDKARKTFDDFNVNYLRTEINQAKGSAQMAEKWRQIEEEKDIFPFLKYKTVADGRVREQHKSLDGVVKEVNDPFWDEYLPKNGWNCRCTVQQLSEGVVTPKSEVIIPDVPDYMKFNSGKQKALFSPEHPYFIVEDQYKASRDDNFGLPKPSQIRQATINKKLK